jgi:hypothetical protein
MAIPVYVAFTFASHLNNPLINPMAYWLSDYGNALVNPDGAALYNTGCVMTAVLLAIFYIGLYRWYGRDRAARKFNISYAISQVCGLMGSVFLILTTVFTLGLHTQMHKVFSTANMIAMDCFLSFAAVGFLMNPKIHKSVGIFGFLISIFNVITMNAFTDFYVAEWIFFFLFMVNLVLITLNYDRLIGQKTYQANEENTLEQ